MKQFIRTLVAGAILLLLSGCAARFEIKNPLQISGKKQVERGLASWYGPGFYGRKTANGEVYNGREMTAAHRTLSFNSQVKVIRTDNGRSIIVRINDRGPWTKGCIIDLSRTAAEKLGLVKNTEVEIRLVK